MHLRAALEAERLRDEPEDHDDPERHGEHRAACAERRGGRRRHRHAGRRRREEDQAHRTAVARDRVGGPGELLPREPQQREQNRDLAGAAPGRVIDEQPDQLREGENVRQVEEELDRICGEVLGALG
jgi:hypothetical protein